MINIRFLKNGGCYRSFEVSGHAGYAEKGSDIVCAAVSSSVQLAINTFTDVMELPAETQVEENRIAFAVKTDEPAAQQLMEGLYRHMSLLSEDYPQNVRVKVTNRNA
ncbi:MAG: ribosomal-processing cysteine protease Prp [Provencibacterium sp.]|jgi:uncharacterized protein YsxB (DUF464 family)|nr:ribosomal-processing cysteine protease Prp [Provencibacterium sp.]